jgi:hypothetical protein
VAHDLDEAAFPAWREAGRVETARRIREGDEDHLVAFALQSQAFTNTRPIEPALSAKAFVEGGAIPDDAAWRLSAVAMALHGNDPEPHLVTFRSLASDRRALEAMYRRSMAMLYEQEFRTPPSREARGAVYQRRGLSTDSAIEAGFAVHAGLAVLRGLDPTRRVRRVAIVGPGLEIGPRTGFVEGAPPQSPQPFAVIDALLALDLARLDDLEVLCLDVNPRVVDHLTRVRNQPPRLTLSSALLRSDGAGLMRDYVSYVATLGARIGSVEASGARRMVTVRPDVAARLRPLRLDVVGERLDAQADLVIATNVLAYFDDRQLAVALANIGALMAPDGVLLHNEARPIMDDLSRAAGLPLRQGRTVTIAAPDGAPPLYDTVWLHGR